MSDLLGKTLGNRYLLLEKIGDGGMSLVYKARCQLLNRYVAVKILRPEFITDDEFIMKFKKESLAAASLSHPNIVGIYDVGEQEGIYYIVMEYINGKTLKEYIREKGKLDYRETLEISSKIALALENAHKNGIVHRDIKPHNILMTEDGIIKVTDFGIARASTSTTMTNTGRVMGSAHYFSPEQARGGFSDHRTDIYSLGVVMYEMLTGRLPYEADSPISVAIKHIQEKFIEPSEVDKDVPRAVNDIVVKAMEKDMADRYQSSREMIGDIMTAQRRPDLGLLDDEREKDHTRVIPVEDISKAIERDAKRSGKRKKIWISLIILVGLFILGTSASYFYKYYFVVQEVKVPPIFELNSADAERLLNNSNLKMDIAGRRDDNRPENTVIQVIPDVGSNVKENSTVRVILSSGPKKVKIPDLKNLDQVESESKLIALGLKASIERKNSDEVPEGRVIGQEPETGTEVTIGSEVNIIISLGPAEKSVAVPILIGKTREEAEKILTENKLVLGSVTVGTVRNKNYTDGVIINQSINIGKEVKEGSTINITLNPPKEKDEGEEPVNDNTGRV